MKKILIVDDEMGIVDELREFFQEEGFEVGNADTVKDGLLKLDEFKPDVLIIDMKLPDGTGIDVLRHCKQAHPNTKTIVATGYVDQKAMDEAESLQRDLFLQKPFDLVRIYNEIQRLLN